MTKEEKYFKAVTYLDKWMKNFEKERWISDYCKSNHYTEIAVYGYGMFGKHLVRELTLNECNIKWVMDRSAIGDDLYSEIIRADNIENIADVDLIIVASISYVEEIEVLLMKYFTADIISIGEIIDSVTAMGGQSWEKI